MLSNLPIYRAKKFDYLPPARNEATNYQSKSSMSVSDSNTYYVYVPTQGNRKEGIFSKNLATVLAYSLDKDAKFSRETLPAGRIELISQSGFGINMDEKTVAVFANRENISNTDMRSLFAMYGFTGFLKSINIPKNGVVIEAELVEEDIKRGFAIALIDNSTIRTRITERVRIVKLPMNFNNLTDFRLVSAKAFPPIAESKAEVEKKILPEAPRMKMLAIVIPDTSRYLLAHTTNKHIVRHLASYAFLIAAYPHEYKVEEMDHLKLISEEFTEEQNRKVYEIFLLETMKKHKDNFKLVGYLNWISSQDVFEKDMVIVQP